MKKRILSDLAYYLNLFKIKGHETWRADIKDTKEGFENTFKNPQNKRPDITDRKTFRIDRLTGEIKQI